MVLYLVGTAHADLKGPERLKKFLNFVRPTSIGHESSEEGAVMALREKSNNILNLLLSFHSNPAERLARRIDYVHGYEIWVPYSHKHDDNPTVKIHALESQLMVQYAFENLERDYLPSKKTKITSTWEKNMIEALRSGNTEKFQESIELGYHKNFEQECQKKYLTTERDLLMELKIRRILAGDKKGTTVITCGALHFFGDYENLYERLKDLSPCRIRLPEVDHF